MLDFYGLHVSYVTLFPGGVYMEIEYLRLDFHLKRKPKKTTRAAPTCSSEKKERKKKPREEGVRRRKEKKKKNQMRDLGSPRSDLGRGATAACVAGLDLARPGS